MSVKVYIEGKVVDPDQARVSVFDRGFLYGDSIYETLRTSQGQPFAVTEHLTRLARSAQAIGLCYPNLDQEARAAIDQTLAQANNPESYIRVVVTRGAGEIGLDPGLAEQPQLLVIVRPLSVPSREQYEQGVKVALVERRRNARNATDPGVKSGNYLNNVLAIGEAKRKGAYEALMCDQMGYLAECSSSNFFAVIEGTILTPSLDVGILAGVTRGIVLQLVKRLGLSAREALLLPTDLERAEEAFLTSTLRGVLPIVAVDDKPIANGKVGPITRKLQAAYQEFLESGGKSEDL